MTFQIYSDISFQPVYKVRIINKCFPYGCSHFMIVIGLTRFQFGLSNYSMI